MERVCVRINNMRRVKQCNQPEPNRLISQVIFRLRYSRFLSFYFGINVIKTLHLKSISYFLIQTLE